MFLIVSVGEFKITLLRLEDPAQQSTLSTTAFISNGFQRRDTEQPWPQVLHHKVLYYVYIFLINYV